MSNVYPATLNGITYHPINFPHGGAITLENASRWWLYVAIGYYANISDVKSFSVASVAPGQTRMFGMNLQQQAPVLSIATTDKPFALTSTVNQSPDVIRVEEIASASGAVPFPDNPSTGLIADYLVIAGGQIRMDQNAIYAHDLLSNPVIMINMLAGAIWNGQTLNIGDVVIGTYATGDGLYWNAQSQTLLIKGNVSVTGGNAALNIQGVDGTWTSSTPTQLTWTGVHVEYGGGKPLKTLTDGSHTLTVNVEYGYILDSDNLLHWETDIKNIPINATTIVCAIAGTLKVTIQVLVGTTWISGDQIVTGSIVANRLSVNQLSAISADLGSITAGTVTGATLQTAATGVRAVLNASNFTRYLDNGSLSLDFWYDQASNRLAQIIETLADVSGSTNFQIAGYANQNTPNQGTLDITQYDKTGTTSHFSRLRLISLATSSDGGPLWELRAVDTAAGGKTILTGYVTPNNQRIEMDFTGSKPVYSFQPAAVFTPADHFATSGLGHGLSDRVYNHNTSPDDHFRSGVIPTSYTWRAAPFNGAPTGGLTYSQVGDYLCFYEPTAANRYFLARNVTNSAAAWQSKELRGRFAVGLSGRAGLRYDDGSDNNYVELLIDGTANNATQTLIFRYRAGGGAVTTVTSAINIPAGEFLVLRLLNLWTGTQYQGFGYLLQEGSVAVNITSFNTPALGWIPAAGRAGILADFTGVANPVLTDWLLNNFG